MSPETRRGTGKAPALAPWTTAAQGTARETRAHGAGCLQARGVAPRANWRPEATCPEGDVDERNQHRHLDQRADTPASAWPDSAPQTPTATAMASSKSFEATVKPMLAVWAYGNPITFPITKPATHITAK